MISQSWPPLIQSPWSPRPQVSAEDTEENIGTPLTSGCLLLHLPSTCSPARLTERHLAQPCPHVQVPHLGTFPMKAAKSFPEVHGEGCKMDSRNLSQHKLWPRARGLLSRTRKRSLCVASIHVLSRWELSDGFSPCGETNRQGPI